jgi:hypothetical protein
MDKQIQQRTTMAKLDSVYNSNSGHLGTSPSTQTAKSPPLLHFDKLAQLDITELSILGGGVIFLCPLTCKCPKVPPNKECQTDILQLLCIKIYSKARVETPHNKTNMTHTHCMSITLKKEGEEDGNCHPDSIGCHSSG